MLVLVPESRQFCLVFVDLFAGGHSTAATVTLDTVADESRKKMADGVAGSRLGFVAETGRFFTMDALSTIFLLLCIASYFSYFLLPYPGMFYLLCVPSSVQQSSATLSKYVFYSTCSLFWCHLNSLFLFD